MRTLEHFDRWIAGKVKHWTSLISGSSHPTELLEIRRDILHDIRGRIEPKGGGKCLFPYNKVMIDIAAAGEEEGNVFTAFCETRELENDIRDLLTETACPIPNGFKVIVNVVEDADRAASGRPYEIDYANEKTATDEPTSAAESRPTIKLTVVRGEADPTEFTIDAERVNIGRLKEVVGEKDGLRRRNDIAFAETETTVSREHAHIRYDVESGKFRLFDSGSARGTSIFRDGRRLDAPKVRGIQLRPGDEIHVGDGRVRFELL